MPRDILSQYTPYGDYAFSGRQQLGSERGLWMSDEHLQIATVRYDRNFCHIYASPAYLQIIVSKGADILGKSVDERWWPTNISVKAYREVLEAVMLSGRESELTLEWIGEDGRLVSYIEKLAPEYDASGEIAGVSVFMIDVSMLRQRQLVESKRLSVFERLVHGDDLVGILEQVAFYVESAKPGVYCSIWMLDDARKCLQTVAAPSLSDSYKTMLDLCVLADDLGRGDGRVSSALRAERVIIDDLGKQEGLSSCHAIVRNMGVAACWFEPILSVSRQVQGVLCLYLKQPGMPDQGDLALLIQAAHLSALSIERKRFEQQIYMQACYDPLTNLPNRRLFIKRLHEEIVKAERGAYGLAVLFIDLDHFKEVNDTLGHEAGDDLLIEAARRIHACIRETDTVARLGGDEFVIILPQICKIKLFERVAQDIVSVMQLPFYHGDHPVNVSASVGIARYPVDASNPESLIRCADQAMYAAKDKGRNTYSISSCGLSASD